LLLCFVLHFVGLRAEVCVPKALRASTPSTLARISARVAAGPNRSALFCFKVGAIALPNRAA
jgi:hypothetical protein